MVTIASKYIYFRAPLMGAAIQNKHTTFRRDLYLIKRKIPLSLSLSLCYSVNLNVNRADARELADLSRSAEGTSRDGIGDISFRRIAARQNSKYTTPACLPRCTIIIISPPPCFTGYEGHALYAHASPR